MMSSCTTEHLAGLAKPAAASTARILFASTTHYFAAIVTVVAQHPPPMCIHSSRFVPLGKQEGKVSQ